MANRVYVRKHEAARRNRGWRLRDKLAVEIARLSETLPELKWQTVGSGKSARRVPVRDPKREAIMKRINSLSHRRDRLGGILPEIADEPLPKWPHDHEAKHRQAALKGWAKRRRR